MGSGIGSECWTPAFWRASDSILVQFGLRPSTEDSKEFHLLTIADVSLQPPPKIFGARKFASLLVALDGHDAEYERFQLTQMAVADGQIHAEAVP